MSHSTIDRHGIEERELLPFGHGKKRGFFAHHSVIDTSTISKKYTN
jgi:hypothetical protein